MGRWRSPLDRETLSEHVMWFCTREESGRRAVQPSVGGRRLSIDAQAPVAVANDCCVLPSLFSPVLSHTSSLALFIFFAVFAEHADYFVWWIGQLSSIQIQIIWNIISSRSCESVSQSGPWKPVFWVKASPFDWNVIPRYPRTSPHPSYIRSALFYTPPCFYSKSSAPVGEVGSAKTITSSGQAGKKQTEKQKQRGNRQQPTLIFHQQQSRRRRRRLELWLFPRRSLGHVPK